MTSAVPASSGVPGVSGLFSDLPRPVPWQNPGGPGALVDTRRSPFEIADPMGLVRRPVAPTR